jgi:putative inorganic carbon (HCO3(-)) transporter
MVGLALAGTAWGGSKILPADFARLPYLLGSIWYSAGFHPNIVGGALALLLPSTAAYALAARSWSRRLLFGLLLLVGILALIMTQSRGAIAGFAAALLVVAIARRRRWAWLVLVLAVLVVAVILWPGAHQALDLVLDSAGTGTAQSREARLELLSRGLYMVEDFPVTGVGLGMFSDTLPLLYPLFLRGASSDVPHAHNVLLQMAIDHGLPGLTAFLALLILLVVMAVRSLALSRGRRLEPLAVGLSAGLVAYAFHGLVDHVWHTPRSHPIVWAYFGLIAALWTSLQTEGAAI